MTKNETQTEKFDKQKKKMKKEMYELTYKDLFFKLHENFSHYKEEAHNIQLLNTNIQKEKAKLDEVKQKTELKTKDLDKINKLQKNLDEYNKQIKEKQDSITSKEPEFVAVQEIISKISKINFRVSEITSIIVINLFNQDQTKEFMNTKVKDLIK